MDRRRLFWLRGEGRSWYTPCHSLSVVLRITFSSMELQYSNFNNIWTLLDISTCNLCLPVQPWSCKLDSRFLQEVRRHQEWCSYPLLLKLLTYFRYIFPTFYLSKIISTLKRIFSLWRTVVYNLKVVLLFEVVNVGHCVLSSWLCRIGENKQTHVVWAKAAAFIWSTRLKLVSWMP